MSQTHAQAEFAAQFLTVMVAAAGLALAALRPDPRRRGGRPGSGGGWWSRVLAIIAFLVAGAVAFVQGSLLVTGDADRLAVALLVAAVALAAALPRWSGGRRSRLLLLVGVAGWAGSAVADLLGASSGVVDGLLAGGSLAIGLALLSAGRQSIAARVAASAAATLLLVVLVLAVALSAVISSSLQHDELNRLGVRARTESSQVGDTVAAAVKNARFLVGSLQGYFHQSNPNPLIAFAGGSGGALIRPPLQNLSDLYPVGGIAYTNPAGTAQVVTSGMSVGVARALSANPMLRPACGSGGQGSVFVVGGQAWAAAAYPECQAGTGRVLGTLLSATPLDHFYLLGRTRVDPTVSLALTTPQSLLAAAGRQPPASALLASAAGGAVTSTSGNTFVAVVPVAVGQGSPAVRMVLSTPTTTLISTRDKLYRTLFLIALGGTVLALGLAAFTGDRITAGIRRLTQVAARIEGGNTSERAAISGDDEVATLGSAFDSMVDSVEEQASALQAAADDETRLRNRLEAVVAGMTDALVAVDARGLITDYNRAAERLLGVGSAAALGRRVEDVVQLVDGDGGPINGQMVNSTPEPWAVLGSIHPRGGGTIPVAASSGALRGPQGEVAGRVLVIRDLRREQEIERMKSEFLSRVGHELRTPLTGIMGYADILLRRNVTADRARTWLDEILQASRRLLRIVEMLEFFASSGAGRVLLRPEPLDPGGLVNGLTAAWSDRLPANLSIGRRVARGTGPILADRRWLTMAIDELIDNAVKFSPDGGRILVSTASGKDGVEISVTDHGVGMTVDEGDGVFSDFVQADGSDTRRFGGLGLGLAVVRRVIDSHGGQVRCRSVLGRGTTMTIVLPSAPGRVITHSAPSPVLG